VLAALGVGAVAAFVIIRALNVYGDPQPWSVQERGPLYTVLSFVNTTKYPPSLQYLLMTLGPAIALMPAYYVIHIPLVHASARAWYWLALGAPRATLFDRAQWPAGYEPNLLRAYAVWAVTVFVLYWPSRWFMELRRRRDDWWLSYL
jgi:hypothetical protein